MKGKLIILFVFNVIVVMAQTPYTDQNWILNNTFSDEFNGSKKDVWIDFHNENYWGSQIFLRQNIQFESEHGRAFLRLKAEMENGTPYSGGMYTGYSVYSNTGLYGLGYGYYEIEARVIQTPNIVSGIWPAFWMQHANFSYPFWYEEMDIFEPDYCQVINNNHHVTYWNIDDSTRIFSIDSNSRNSTGDKYNVNMSEWHKYALEWLPKRVVFYIDDENVLELCDTINHPYHQNTCLRIDLQTGKFGEGCAPDSSINGLLGYFDVNYFRYYQLSCSDEVITESQGNGYNFNNYTSDVKRSCVFKNTTIPYGNSITVRATDFIELKESFEVPIGASYTAIVHDCPY